MSFWSLGDGGRGGVNGRHVVFGHGLVLSMSRQAR
jgi:hypothetical protein